MSITLYVLDMQLVWNGYHTVNVWRNGHNVDVFTFGWEHERPNASEFFRAASAWLDD